MGDSKLIQELLMEDQSFRFKIIQTEILSKGLEISKNNKFDVILLDLSLPDSSGLNTLLNAIEKINNCPIVILTGLNDEVLIRRAVQLGAQDYLVKGQITSGILIKSIYQSIDRFKMINNLTKLTNSFKEEEKKLRTIIDSNINCMLIVDKDKIIRFANSASEKFFGKRFISFIGQVFEYPILIGANYEIEVFKENGSKVYGQIQAVDIKWNQENAYLITIQDISKRKNAELALKMSELKYRSLIENLDSAITCINKDGIYLDVNEMAAKNLGGKSKDFIGKSLFDIFPKNVAQKRIDECKKIIETRSGVSYEKTINSSRGKKIFFVNDQPLKDLSGDAIAIQSIEIDITELRQTKQDVIFLEQTLHEMNALIENAPLAIFLLAPSGKVLRANEAAKELFEYEDEILNYEMINFFYNNYIEIAKNHFENDIYNLSRPNHFEAKIVTKTGKLIDVEITSTILKIADDLIIQSFISDISDRKNYERIRELLLDRLSTSLEFKSKFLASISHELRTPLNSILGFSSLLLETSSEISKEYFIDYLKDINSAGNHLLVLIDNILDLSKIEVGKFKLNIEKINIKQIIDEVQSILKTLYEKKKLNFNIEGICDDHFLNADSIKFKQILYNLFDNAIKFTEKGTITLKYILKRDYWQFQIEDTGVGIAKQDFDVVFREFGRIENDRIKNVSGSGLGLALTKRLVQLHGGDIWFESELGKGSIFYFTIPKSLKITNKN